MTETFNILAIVFGTDNHKSTYPNHNNNEKRQKAPNTIISHFWIKSYLGGKEQRKKGCTPLEHIFHFKNYYTLNQTLLHLSQRLPRHTGLKNLGN